MKPTHHRNLLVPAYIANAKRRTLEARVTMGDGLSFETNPTSAAEDGTKDPTWTRLPSRSQLVMLNPRPRASYPRTGIGMNINCPVFPPAPPRHAVDDEGVA